MVERDHWPDRYDVVEIVGPEDVLPPAWLTADWMPCPDCRANAVLRYDAAAEGNWRVTVAHDETCPTLARIERELR